MTEQTELLAGAVTNLHNAIRPLIYPQPHWDGYRALQSDPLYTRMRDACTVTTPTSGARLQGSKAPARIDVMAWFCDIDSTCAQWPGPNTTTTAKLEHYYHHTWTPDHLRFVKAVTRRSEYWTESAKELLGDNPSVVPLRKPCPLCNEFWHYTGAENTRQFALRVSEAGAQCHACKAKWVSNQEISVLIKMLG
jgi:hypothetical protein